MTWRTLLLDDDPIMRMLMRRGLEAEGSFSVVAEAGDPTRARQRIVETRPDCVVTDLHLREGPAPAWLPGLREAAPEARFFIVTGTDRPEDTPGFAGLGRVLVFTKDEGPRRIAEGIREAMGKRLLA